MQALTNMSSARGLMMSQGYSDVEMQKSIEKLKSDKESLAKDLITSDSLTSQFKEQC
jgi:hypothetical protein